MLVRGAKSFYQSFAAASSHWKRFVAWRAQRQNAINNLSPGRRLVETSVIKSTARISSTAAYSLNRFV